MDHADLACRTQLITGPLLEVLARTWPGLRVALDTGAATARPGAPLGVRWTDGPTTAELLAALGGGTDSSDAGLQATSGAYPVRPSRFYSHTAWAWALMLLREQEALPALAHGPREMFWSTLDALLGARSLPGEICRRQWQRASLLAEVAGAAGGGDALSWARWLQADDWAQADAALEAVLSPTI